MDHHLALKEWYERYTDRDEPLPCVQIKAALSSVKDDALDQDLIDKAISQTVLTTTVQNDYCQKCTRMLQVWPSDEILFSKPGEPRSTAEIEAASMLGCRFCRFAFNILQESDALETFRKVERRLAIFNYNVSCTFSVFFDFITEQQFIWISPPGDPKDHEYVNLTRFVSRKLDTGSFALLIVHELTSP